MAEIPNFPTAQKRLKKAMLSYRGNGVRLRGSRKEYIQQGTRFVGGGESRVMRDAWNSNGYVWLFVQPLNVFVDQTIAVFPQTLDNGLVGKNSVGFSIYLENGKVCFAFQENSGRPLFKARCLNTTPVINSIMVERGANFIDSSEAQEVDAQGIPQTYCRIYVNNVLQKLVYQNMPAPNSNSFSEPHRMVFGSQKETTHDFVLKQVLFGTKMYPADRDFIYNRAMGVNMPMFNILKNENTDNNGLNLLKSSITYYVDWTQHDNGIFYANKVQEGPGAAHLTPFPGFTLDDVGSNFRSVFTPQIGGSFNLPADKTFSPVLKNYIYPGCKTYYNNFPYEGGIMQYNGSTDLPQDMRRFVAYQSTIGSTVAGETLTSNITRSRIEHLEMWDQTPSGYHALIWAGQETDMDLFDVRRAKLKQLRIASAGGRTLIVHKLDYSGNYELSQPFNDLYDPNATKVIELVGSNIGFGLTGPPRFDDQMVNFDCDNWQGATGAFPRPTDSVRFIKCTGGAITGYPSDFNKVTNLHIHGQNLYGTLIADNAHTIRLGSGGGWGAANQQRSNNIADDFNDVNLINNRYIVTLSLDCTKLRNLYFPTQAPVNITEFDAAWNANMVFANGFPDNVTFTGGFYLDYSTSVASYPFPLGTRIVATSISMANMGMSQFYINANIDRWIDNQSAWVGPSVHKQWSINMEANGYFSLDGRANRFSQMLNVVYNYNWLLSLNNPYDNDSYMLRFTVLGGINGPSGQPRIIIRTASGLYGAYPGDYVDLYSTGSYDGRWIIKSHGYTDRFNDGQMVNYADDFILEKVGQAQGFSTTVMGAMYIRGRGENGNIGAYGYPAGY